MKCFYFYNTYIPPSTWDARSIIVTTASCQEEFTRLVKEASTSSTQYTYLKVKSRL